MFFIEYHMVRLKKKKFGTRLIELTRIKSRLTAIFTFGYYLIYILFVQIANAISVTHICVILSILNMLEVR